MVANYASSIKRNMKPADVNNPQREKCEIIKLIKSITIKFNIKGKIDSASWDHPGFLRSSLSLTK